MQITAHSLPPPIPATRLSFVRTVDRALIHRRNPDEAFLTDAVRTGPHGFAAAALLPPAHPHYAGHTGPSRDLDPMLLLESARQAETYAAHTMFGVEPDARFVLRSWSAEFAARLPQVAGGPAELLMTAVTGSPKMVRGRIGRLDYELEFWLADARVGRVGMEVGYVSAAAYRIIRSHKHPGPLPSLDDLAPPNGSPVAPARVGRVRATDALLLDVVAGARTVTARLRVPAGNPSLFDHAQDHIPAMVLVEAARQLAALATQVWGGAAPDRTRMASMSSSFGAYAELNEPVEMTALPLAAAAAGGGGGRSVAVTFRQAGSDIAQARVVMAVPEQVREHGRSRKGGTTWLGPRS